MKQKLCLCLAMSVHRERKKVRTLNDLFSTFRHKTDLSKHCGQVFSFSIIHVTDFHQDISRLIPTRWRFYICTLSVVTKFLHKTGKEISRIVIHTVCIRYRIPNYICKILLPLISVYVVWTRPCKVYCKRKCQWLCCKICYRWQTT